MQYWTWQKETLSLALLSSSSYYILSVVNLWRRYVDTYSLVASLTELSSPRLSILSVSAYSAHASSESHSHDLAARPHHSAGRDHLLQNPGHFWDPQGVLWRPLTQHPAVGREGHRGTFVPEAGEWDEGPKITLCGFLYFLSPSFAGELSDSH